MTLNVLITGAGGPCSIAFLKAIAPLKATVHMADMDPLAAGLYLVEGTRRLLVPRGNAPNFVDAILAACRRRSIDVLVPTVDSELLPLARRRDEVEAAGIKLLCPKREALENTLDKLTLARRLEAHLAVPKTHSATAAASFAPEEWPLILKPRSGSGSRDVSLVASREEMPPLEDAEAFILQQVLPGQEYSVDVLATREGRVLAAVPRERMKVDSGVAVTSRTVRDAELENMASRAVEELGLPYISNVQLKRRADGRPALLEINPRVPGTMPLTVAAGVNMPLRALLDCLGRDTGGAIEPFKEMLVVRYLHEQFLSCDDLDAVVAQLDAEAAE